jgi:hypothetical protein
METGRSKSPAHSSPSSSRNVAANCSAGPRIQCACQVPPAVGTLVVRKDLAELGVPLKFLIHAHRVGKPLVDFAHRRQ